MRLEVVYRRVEDILFDPRNTNTHSEEQIEELTYSIEEFEFVQPILIDESDTLIAGEGRLLAAKKIGMEEVPTIKLSHLSPVQRRAYAIADNQLARKSEFDIPKLLAELDSLVEDAANVVAVGFDEEEIARLRAIVMDDQEELTEAGKGTGEEVPIEGAGLGKETRLRFLKYGSRRIPMDDEEFALIDKKFVEYVDENGVASGFVAWLLGVGKDDVGA